jgi:hypothetical protein
MPFQKWPKAYTLRAFLIVWLLGLGIYVMNSFKNRTSVSLGNWRQHWSRCDCCNHSKSENLKSSNDLTRGKTSVLLRNSPHNDTADPYYFPDWRVKFASTPLPWSYNTIVTERRKSSDPNAPCSTIQNNIKWTGDWWDELVPDVGSCCARCRKRNSCVAFSFVSDACLLFSRLTGSVQDPGCVSALVDTHPAPPDCRTLGTPCDCPPSTWAAPNPADDLPDRAAACELLAGRQLFAAGDSLVRDTWTALALWLLVADGVDVVLRAGANHHAACLSCAWKMLILLGVKQDLEARGLLVEGPPETYSLSACGGRASLAFIPAPRFSDLDSVLATVAERARGGVADLLVVGAGVHEMVHAGDDEAPVRAWARRVTAAAGPAPPPADGTGVAARGAVVLGTHARIAALAPAQYRDYAEGPQGNAKIRGWNAATAKEVAAAAAAGRPAAFVDPYRLTAELVRCNSLSMIVEGGLCCPGLHCRSVTGAAPQTLMCEGDSRFRQCWREMLLESVMRQRATYWGTHAKCGIG